MNTAKGITKAALDRCWQSGFESYEAGISEDCCPLKAGSGAQRAWSEGWAAAELVHKRTNFSHPYSPK